MALDWQTEYRRYQHYFLNASTFYRQRKFRAYTELVLTILAICFFLFFAIKPTFVTITGLIKAIKDQKLVAQKLEEKINALNIARNQYELTQPDLYLIDEAFPKQPQLATLVRQLETLAFRSGATTDGMQFTQINLRNKVPVSGQEPLNFGLAVTGDYLNLREFLKNLSSLRRIILIDSFSFKTGKTEKLTLYLSLNSKAFYGTAKK